MAAIRTSTNSFEELTGKRRKKKNERRGERPLSEVVKQMREVERRLSQPDTGEETRKKQEQIVKRIETLIEQARTSSQSQRRQRQNRPMKPGEQPGEPQDQPGENGGNAPFTKAAKPENKRSTAGGKDAWGHPAARTAARDGQRLQGRSAPLA